MIIKWFSLNNLIIVNLSSISHNKIYDITFIKAGIIIFLNYYIEFVEINN